MTGDVPRNDSSKGKHEQPLLGSETRMKTFLKAMNMSVIAAVLCSGSALLIGCNTAKEGAHGAGQDMKNAGQGIEHAGEKVKEKTE